MKKKNSQPSYTAQAAARLYALCEKSDPFAYSRMYSNIQFLRGAHRADLVRDTIEICADRLHMEIRDAIALVA